MSGGAWQPTFAYRPQGMVDAVVLEWNVTVGFDVTAGDVLVTLETAKATIDVEAPISGQVLSPRGSGRAG